VVTVLPASSTPQAPAQGRRKRAAPRPFVKWAGGKAQLVQRFLEVFPRRFERYFEPFLGGGAVYLALRPERAVLSDLNADLMNAWRIVRDDPAALMTALDAHVYERAHYYRVRALDPEALDPVQRAARFIYLNKTCYNGLYRVNSRGRFNVPFGRYPRPPKLYERANLLAVSRLLRDAELLCAPFEEATARAGPGDFVYLDPPYDPLSPTANFTSYTQASFTREDQRRLAAHVRELDGRGCLIAVSNSDTPEIRELYRGFRVETVRMPRHINCKPDGRAPIHELLITNFDPGPAP
jgi:DNA adenine methylase